MKILLLNGSPHENGTTNEALTVLKGLLTKKNISSHIFHIGANASACRGCFHCLNTRKCVLDDQVNKLLEIIC